MNLVPITAANVKVGTQFELSGTSCVVTSVKRNSFGMVVLSFVPEIPGGETQTLVSLLIVEDTFPINLITN